MIGVKAITGERSEKALHDNSVVVALNLFDSGSFHSVYVLTISKDVAQRIVTAKPKWKHFFCANHAFRTDQDGPDKVAAMLAGILPEIDHWETW